MARVLVGVKRVIDYAVKVRIGHTELRLPLPVASSYHLLCLVLRNRFY